MNCRYSICLGRSGFVIAAMLLAAVPILSLAANYYPPVVERHFTGDPIARNPASITEGPKAFAVGDLNGDGRPDVVAGNLDGSISVLLAKSSEFGLNDQILIPATGILEKSSLRGIALADYNRDGRLDVAAGDIVGNGVVVLFGQGNGRMVPFQKISVGPVRALTTGDFNNDSMVDLLVACGPSDCEWMNYCCGTSNRFVCVLMGNGNGTFQPPQYLLYPGGNSCFYDVSAADINSDGSPDAMVLEYTSVFQGTNTSGTIQQISIFTNNGAGLFTGGRPQKILSIPQSGSRAFITAYADELLSNGNPPKSGTLDIIVANRNSGTLSVYLNRGSLNFTNAYTINAGDSPRDIAAADLDGDGHNDLAVVNRFNSTLSLLKGLGDGNFSPPVAELPTGISPRQVVLADFDQDGALDAVVNNRISEDVGLLHGQTNYLGFLMPDTYYASGVSPVSLVAGDFNGDGYPDTAVASVRSHDVRVRLNTKSGTMGDETVYPVNYGPSFIETTDLNHDGKLDLIVSCLGRSPIVNTNEIAALVILLGNGNGTFQAPIKIAIDSFLRPYWLRVADLSGDGNADLLVSGLSGDLFFYRGKGDGTLENGVRILYGSGRPLGIATGDFDRDGKIDFAISRGVVYFNDGVFSQPLTTNSLAYKTWRTTNFVAGIQAWATEAEDLDGDGILDLMVALTFQRPDPVAIFYGKADGSFEQPLVYEGPDVGVVGIMATDVNGDGKKDLLIGNRCAASVIVMTATTNRQFQYEQIIPAPSVEDIVVADFNKDGKPDIAGAGFGLWLCLHGGTNNMVKTGPSAAQSIATLPGVCINEVMSYNVKYLVISNASPDWIELFNNSPGPINLTGWSLAQVGFGSVTNRWFFPAGNSIRPYGYLTVYGYIGSYMLPGLMASFGLSADGEDIMVLDASGKVVDRVNFPALPEDASFARYPDAGRYFTLTPIPTFGSGNQRPANMKPMVERKQPFITPGATRIGITAWLYDDTGVAYAAVGYRTNNSTFITEIPLNDDGTSGDKEAGDGYYGVMLPPMKSGTVVDFYLRAVDLEGQVASTPDDIDNITNYHRITIPFTQSSLRISELMADNQTGINDEYGTRDDWIEIVNTGTTNISLAGLGLTLDIFRLTNIWMLPANRTLAPGQSLIVFCDNQPLPNNGLHATFTLQRTGDRVYLVRKNGEILDSLCFGPLPTDVSYGVCGKAADAQIIVWPSPGSANNFSTTSAAAEGKIFHKVTFQPGMGFNTLDLRWVDSGANQPALEWSSDLKTWNTVTNSPRILGQGYYDYSEPIRNNTNRFIRIRR